MAWSNVTLERPNDVRDRRHAVLMQAEMEFWKREAERLTEVLENVPRAVEQFGYVRISVAHGPDVTLVAKPESDSEEA